MPSSRLTKILQEKAELLKRQRQTAEQTLHDAQERVRLLQAIGIVLPESSKRTEELAGLVKHSDWEGVETQAKSFQQYIAQAAEGAFATRREELSERAKKVQEFGLPLPPELPTTLESLSASSEAADWTRSIEALASVSRILDEAVRSFGVSARERLLALAEWSGEADGRSKELADLAGSALGPLSDGDLVSAAGNVNQIVLRELPKAAQRREAARETARAILAAARDLGIGSEALEAALRADAQAAPIDWLSTVGLVESNANAVAETLRTRVAATIESMRATLESIREYDIDSTEAQTKLQEILGSVNAVPPGEVPALLQQARGITEEPVVSIVAGLLDAVRPRLVEARRMGRDASDVFATMNRAREALRLKIYSEALAASQEAVDRVSSLTGDLDAARDETESLSELLVRLSGTKFPTAPFEESLTKIRDRLGRVELEPAQALLAETMQRLGDEAAAFFLERLAILETLLPMAADRSFLPEGTREELDRIRKELEDGEIASAGEKLSALDARLRTAAEPFISRRVEELENAFEDVPNKEMVAPVRRLLADADVNLRVKGDLPASLESLKRAEKEFTSVFAAHASSLVEILEEERRTLESMGGAGDELQRQIDEVQQIFNMGDFVKASHASQELRTRAHQQQLLRGEEALSHAKLALVELGKMGVEVAGLKTSLDAAQEAAKAQRYAEAYRLAAETQEAAVRLKTRAQAILDTLSQASSLYNELKAAGVAAEAHREKIRLAQVAYQAVDLDGAKEALEVVMALMRAEQASAEVRRLLSEADLLREDAHRLATVPEAALPLLEEARHALEAGNSAEALPKARQVHAELVQLVKPVLSENLRTIEQDLEIAQSAGLDTGPVLEVLGECRRRLAQPVPIGAAELLETARGRLVETRGFLEHAERVRKRAADALSQAELVHVPVPNARERLTAIEAAQNRREYARVVELASTLEREMIQLTYQQVSKSLASLQGVLVRARQAGGDAALAENLLLQARQALDEGRPLESLQLAGRSESEVERIELQLRIAQGSLKTMQSKLSEAEHEGIRAKVAREKVTEAEGAFRDRLYPLVLELAIDASDSLAFTRESFRKAREALVSADRQVKEAMELGGDVGEVVPVLDRARAAQQAGEYPEATRRGREAAEMARWSVERLYTAAVGELRHLRETAEKAGLTVELGPLDTALQAVDAALQTRDWKGASELLQKGRDLATAALTERLDRRAAELEAAYAGLGTPTPAEEERRAEVRKRVLSERQQGALGAAIAVLELEETRVRDLGHRDLEARATALKERLWVGEKLGLDTTPVMEAYSEARMLLEAGRTDGVSAHLEAGETKLKTLVAGRLEERVRDTQTELVFAQDGLHVTVADLAERLKGVPAIAERSPVEAAQLVLETAEEMNQRKALHRELLNLHYLIDAALGKAADRHLETAEPRRLLDESIRLRATDYRAALAKAREALNQLQSLIDRTEPATSFWPFRRPPG